MEIERKFFINDPLPGYKEYPYHAIEQGYLCTEPVVRVRREDDTYYLTYKSRGKLAREEYNLPLTKEAYEHLIGKADGNILTKKRYLIPVEGSHLTIEFDVFEGKFQGLMLAEVEFETEEEANAFVPPEWFGSIRTAGCRGWQVWSCFEPGDHALGRNFILPLTRKSPASWTPAPERGRFSGHLS